MKLSRSTCSRFTMIKTIFVVVSVKRHQIICDFKFPFPLFTSGCSCFCLQTLLICKLSSQLPGKNILLPVYKPASRFQRLQLLFKKKNNNLISLYIKPPSASCSPSFFLCPSFSFWPSSSSSFLFLLMCRGGFSQAWRGGWFQQSQSSEQRRRRRRQHQEFGTRRRRRRRRRKYQSEKHH